MIEEIIPVLKIPNRVRILSADKEVVKKMPVIDSEISFRPFVEFLKDKLDSISGTRADFYKYLIKKFEAEAELLEPVVNVQVLNDHQELIELLSTAIFPVVSEEEKNIFSFSSPYQFKVFSYSESFKKLFIDKDERQLKLPDAISERQLIEI